MVNRTNGVYQAIAVHRTARFWQVAASLHLVHTRMTRTAGASIFSIVNSIGRPTPASLAAQSRIPSCRSASLPSRVTPGRLEVTRRCPKPIATCVGATGWKEDLPKEHWFPNAYYGNEDSGGVRGHYYHVFDTPLYYKSPLASAPIST